MIVTIDGPSGTGKSTIAKMVAAHLGFAFFDTGAMYRAVAWAALQADIPLDDVAALEKLLHNFHFAIHEIAGQKRYSVNHVDITDAIRTNEIASAASKVAVLPIVRKALGAIQREFASNADCVFEGRDMGTNVFPDAEVKIFLTASPEVRAARRYKELASKEGSEVTEKQVFLDILERDHRDTTRAYAPLKKAVDAKEIDTSYLQIDQIVTMIVEYVDARKQS